MEDQIFENPLWRPHVAAGEIETIDMHTGGEPLRVIISGLPDIPGASVLEKRRYFADHHDDIRTSLMWEPRGHADMYGAVITRSETADFDVFFLHNEGYSTMCGHAIIALSRLVVELGLVPSDREEISFQVPAGKILAWPIRRDGKVASARFRNVPSYVALQDASVLVQDIGPVRFDIAYGGAFYAIVEAEAVGAELEAGSIERLIDLGRRIKQSVMNGVAIQHPFEADLSFLYGVIFTGPAKDQRHHSRNVCIFADGEVDRSPTGSGVSARAALHFARGELAIGAEILIESVTSSVMAVKVQSETRFGEYRAIIPEVSGSAYFTGRSRFWIEPDDPLARGFLLR